MGKAEYGYERGAYDPLAILPCDTNWNRNSRFRFPLNPTLEWKMNIKHRDLEFRYLPIVIDRFGNIIITDNDDERRNVGDHGDGRLIRINSNGTMDKIVKFEHHLQFPVIRDDGCYYVMSNMPENNIIYCIHPTGHVVWASQTDIRQHLLPVLDDEGNIYLIDNGGSSPNIICLSRDGAEQWRTRIKSWGYTFLAISASGLILFGSDVVLCACNRSGELLWEKEYQVNMRHPLFAEDGIYITDDYYLIQIDENGEKIHKRQYAGHSLGEGIAVDSEKNLYMHHGGRKLFSLTMDLEPRWLSPFLEYITNAPLVGSCDNIYVSAIAATKKELCRHYIFSNQGEMLWEKELLGEPCSAGLGADGVLYILTRGPIGPISEMDRNWNREWTLYKYVDGAK